MRRGNRLRAGGGARHGGRAPAPPAPLANGGVNTCAAARCAPRRVMPGRRLRILRGGVDRGGRRPGEPRVMPGRRLRILRVRRHGGQRRPLVVSCPARGFVPRERSPYFSGHRERSVPCPARGFVPRERVTAQESPNNTAIVRSRDMDIPLEDLQPATFAGVQGRGLVLVDDRFTENAP